MIAKIRKTRIIHSNRFLGSITKHKRIKVEQVITVSCKCGKSNPLTHHFLDATKGITEDSTHKAAIIKRVIFIYEFNVELFCGGKDS